MQQLEDARARLDLLQADVDTLKDKAIPVEVKMALAEIDAEYEDALNAAKDAYAAAESAAKAAIAEHGESVKGQFLQAVWSKPRVTWDAKALDGYALNHPELFAFRKEGAPSVSIRAIK
jgi:hypothetical protein